MSVAFICPPCREATNDPHGNGWKEINIGPGSFGVKFCPKCYEIYKDKELTWQEINNISLDNN